MIRHKNSYMDFNKLRNNIFYENFNKDNIVKNKNINNSEFIEENHYIKLLIIYQREMSSIIIKQMSKIIFHI